MKTIRWLGVLIAAVVFVAMVITTTVFRFQNPTLTETQLLQRCGLEYVLMAAGGFAVAILIATHTTTKR